MIKTIFILLLTVTGMVTSWAQKSITTQFPLKWKTKIGVTTYRTNMRMNNGLLYIGSNGISRESRNDELDGVYAINPKNGKIQSTYKVPFAGDNDVTGITLAENKLFFGTDNYYFFCFDVKTGQELWKYPLPYDVESTPVNHDFNQDGTMDVSFSVQGYGFYALNGLDGSVIWSQDSISSHNGNVASLLVDVNGDGIKDVVNAGRGAANSDELAGFKMAHYGDYHFALNGKNGSILWFIESGAGIHTSPFLFETNGTKKIALCDSYGEFKVVDLNGKLISRSGFGYGTFSSPIMTKNHYLIFGNTSVQYSENIMESDEYSLFPGEKATVNSVSLDEYTISATTMIADVLGKGSMQAIGLTEQGILFIMNTDGKTLMKLQLLGKGAEASAFIRDVDGDGKLEILIADLDGYLYCYGTNSRGKVEVGGFME